MRKFIELLFDWLEMEPPSRRTLLLTGIFVLFTLMRLPKYLEEIRSQCAQMMVLLTLVYLYLQPLLSETWASLSTRSVGLASGIYSSLPQLGDRRVWLVLGMLGVVALLAVLWKLGKRPFKAGTLKCGTDTEDTENSCFQRGKQHVRQAKCTCVRSDEQLQKLIQKEVQKELQQQEKRQVRVVEAQKGIEDVLKELRGLMDFLKGAQLEQQVHGGMVTQFLEGIWEHVVRDEDEEKVVPKGWVDELEKKRKGLKKEDGMSTQPQGQGPFGLAYPPGLLSQESPPADTSDPASLALGDRGPKVKLCSDESDDSETVEPCANVAPVLLAEKRSKKTKAATFTPIPEERKKAIEASASLEAVQKELQEVKEELKRQKEATRHLSESEKGLTTEQLEHKWLMERNAKRYGPQPLRSLTAEEMTMSPPQLEKKWALERREAFRQRQEALGIPTYECQQCGRYEREGDIHHCMRTQYRGPLQRKSGVPVRQQLIVRERAGGVSVIPQPVVDLQQAKREHAALTKTIEALEKSQAARRPSVHFFPVSGQTSASADSAVTEMEVEEGELPTDTGAVHALEVADASIQPSDFCPRGRHW